MATLIQIRTGLAARLDTISGLEVYRRMPGSISPPCAAVGGPEIDYDNAFQRGGDDWTIPVRVYVSRADDDAGQDALDAYLAPTGAVSVKAAIEGDGTLGGIVDSTRVTRFRGYGNYEIGGIMYLGGEWVCEVMA